MATARLQRAAARDPRPPGPRADQALRRNCSTSASRNLGRCAHLDGANGRNGIEIENDSTACSGGPGPTHRYAALSDLWIEGDFPEHCNGRSFASTRLIGQTLPVLFIRQSRGPIRSLVVRHRPAGLAWRHPTCRRLSLSAALAPHDPPLTPSRAFARSSLSAPAT